MDHPAVAPNMTTIINKTPSELINVYKNNKPSNNITKLFLLKDNTEIPVFGFYISDGSVYALNINGSHFFVDVADIIELRTGV